MIAPLPTTTPTVDLDAKPKHPRMYRVILHNDPITPMEYVVGVLKTVYHKRTMSAVKIMLAAHMTGASLIVIEPLEHAELHVGQVASMARPRGYPLTCTYEPEV